MPDTNPSRIARALLIALGMITLLPGLFMLIAGVYLITLSGSWYFALAGLGMTVARILLVRRRLSGALLYLAVFVASIAWAVWDVGLALWPLFSRLFALAVLALLVLLAIPTLAPGRKTAKARLSYMCALAVAVGLAATFYAALQPQPIQTADGAPTPVPGKAVGTVEPAADWRYFGHTPSGTRHAVLDKITAQNVSDLKVAWTYRTGEIPKGSSEGHVVTPLHVDGVLYGCTQSSQLFALDDETGKEIWHHDPKVQTNNVYPRCRGVGYHDSTAQTSDSGNSVPAAACTRRIIATAVDARLIAVDAQTGEACTDFGDHGSVSLRIGMGSPDKELYFPTAAPTVVRDLVVVGGLVWDNQKTGEPSGVVRAFNVRTGALVWAWDLGNPAITREPPEGQGYTPGTRGHEGNAQQAGTPWGIEMGRFLSPLGIPCQEPPYGTISAIDLATRKVAWSMPLGTTQDTGPLGIATHLPMPIGMPTRGGPVTTSTGLVFIAASQDFYIRALDVRTGKELWKGRLPVGAEATPMTYISPKSGRQFVVISAGGNSATTKKGDYVVAYALPQ